MQQIYRTVDEAVKDNFHQEIIIKRLLKLTESLIFQNYFNYCNFMTA